jgi:hypothetical protein
MTYKSRNKQIFFKVHVLSVGWPLLRSEGFFCNLDVLYGGLLGIDKLYFLIPKKLNFFSSVIFLKIFGH